MKQVLLTQAIENAIPGIDDGLKDLKSSIITHLIKTGKLRGKVTKNKVTVEDNQAFRQAVHAGTASFGRGIEYSFVSVNAPIADVSAALRSHPRVSSYQEQSEVHAGPRPDQLPGDELGDGDTRQAYLIKPAKTGWCTLVNSLGWLGDSDAFMCMLLAADLSETLETRAVVAWGAPDAPFSPAVVFEKGKRVNAVTDYNHSADLEEVFYEEGIAVPECYIVPGGTTTTMQAPRLDEFERADSLFITPVSTEEMHNPDLRRKADTAVAEPDLDDEEELYQKSVDYLTALAQLFRGHALQAGELEWNTRETQPEPEPSAKKPAHERDTAKELYEAAQYGDIAKLRALLAEGVDPNSLHNGRTALLPAAARSVPEVEAIRVLLEAGANPDAGDPEFLPLAHACASSFTDAAKLLVSAGADANAKDKRNKTPLIRAATRGDGELIQMLLDAGADPNWEDDEGRTALSKAIAEPNEQVIEILRKVTSAGNILKSWRSDKAKFSAELRLGLAAQGGDKDYVKQLLAAGAEVNSDSHQEASPLHHAADGGNLEVVKALVQAGAKLEFRSSRDMTPLLTAAEEGHLDVIKFLVSAGANLKAETTDGNDALQYSVRSEKPEVVQFFIDAGLDVNQKGKNTGGTPLHAVAALHTRKSSPAIVECLVKGGADVNATDSKSRKTTPLHIAIGNLELVTKLLELGADPNRADGKGVTPLMLAVQYNLPMVRTLVDAGADPDLQDKLGKTALAHALTTKQEDIVEFLRGMTSRSDSAERPWRNPKGKVTKEERLEQAAKGGDLEFVQQLVAGGVHPISPTGKESGSGYLRKNRLPALHHAAMNGHLQIVEFLLKAGASIEQADWTGKTPLMAAAEGDQADVALYLLNNGANVNAHSYGYTALHHSCHHRNVKLITAFLKAGANVNQKSRYESHTPLHKTAYNFSHKPEALAGILRLLIKAGADVNAEDHNGEKPINYIAAQPDMEAVKLLVDAGADTQHSDGFGRTPAQYARILGHVHIAEYLESLSTATDPV